jgi:inner membrane protein
MDNLTHSLIGAVVAEAAVLFIPVVKSTLPASTRRTLYFSLLVLGSNVPDLDLLYTGIGGDKLSYMLHHRGHTHTLIGAMLISALMHVCALGWLRWRSIASSSADRRWLGVLAVLAPLLHIGMDATNSYGVHPFWPLDNRWFYGDSVFIIEPLFWVAAAPLALLLQSRLARIALWFVQLIAVILAFGSGLVPLPLASTLLLLMAALLLLGWRASARSAAAGSLAAIAGVVVMFLVAGHMAERQISTVTAVQFPRVSLLDNVLTPSPVNPFCWDVIVVQLDQDSYTLRQGTFSLAPALLPASACPKPSANAQTTAMLTPVAIASSDSLQWQGEVVMSRAGLQTLTGSNCEAAAFAVFARALLITREQDRWMIGDLRFDREPGPGFAELLLDANPAVCPGNIPPWTPPRSDLLRQN